MKDVTKCMLMMFPACLAASAKTNKPNIVFVLVDDFRYDAIGYCGNKIVNTPCIDQLATQGLYFKNAFSSTPISSASRASILTGLHERTHRYSFQTGPLEQRYLDEAYPLKLREAGYHTALFGKLGVNCIHPEFLFDELENYDRNTQIKENGYCYKTLNSDTVHLTRYTGQRGLDFIEKQDGKTPFFLAMCFSAPHAHDSSKQQYFWDEGQESLYNDIKVPKPDMSEDKYFNRLPEFIKSGFSRLRWTWRFDTPKKYQYMMKGYYRMISGIDQELGKVRDMLAKKGLDDNTVIVFMGDNGYFLGERQIADKWMMYDLSVRIPLFIYDPRVNKHAEIEEQVLNLDMPSTFVDLAGGNIPSHWQGKSLKGIINNNETKLNRDTILIEHLWEMPFIPSCEGVRTNEWKYFRYVNNGYVEELYNLKEDPREEFDLSKNEKYAEVLSALRNKTDELTHKYSANGWVAPTNIFTTFVGNSKDTSVKKEKQYFGWELPCISKAQKAFQLLVADNKADIEHHVGNMWNSGYVNSGNSIKVEYKGKELKKGQTYYWCVRTWDYLNRTSQYSSVQEFVYGKNEMSYSDDKLVDPAKQMQWGISLTMKSNRLSLRLAPDMANMTKSDICYPTAIGDLVAHYTGKGKTGRYEITVPANVAVDFIIPEDVTGVVLLNDVPQTLNYGTLQLQPGKNSIQIQNNTF